MGWLGRWLLHIRVPDRISEVATVVRRTSAIPPREPILDDRLFIYHIGAYAGRRTLSARSGLEKMKKPASNLQRSYSFMLHGARSISLSPSVAHAGTYLSKGGIKSDWKKVGGDIKSSMNKFDRERVG